jgi:putative flippase GtrA
MLRSISARSQFAGFLVAGGIAAVANFLSRIAFNFVLGYATSIVLAYMVGMATAFVLNRRSVFAPSGKPLRTEALWFTLVNLLAVAQTLLISLLLADVALPAIGFTEHRREVAHAIGIVVPVVTSYVGHRHLTFGRRARNGSGASPLDQDLVQ